MTIGGTLLFFIGLVPSESIFDLMLLLGWQGGCTGYCTVAVVGGGMLRLGSEEPPARGGIVAAPDWRA